MSELSPHQWPSDIIIAKLERLEDRFTAVETILIGMPNTDSKGLVGDVHELFQSRNECRQDIAAIQSRCDREHGRDPGANGKQDTGDMSWLGNKQLLKWLVIVATLGAFVGGIIGALGDRFNWW